MPRYLKTGESELIRSLFLDNLNVGITGQAPNITIRRNSDDFYWDFDDNTFKASGWTTRVGSMSETDATTEPGLYQYSFDMGGLDADTYYVKTTLTGANASNTPQTNEIITGEWMDDSELEKEVMMNVGFDDDTNILTFETWLEIEGVIETAVTNAKLSLRDEDGTEVFTGLSNATPDANGVFKMTKSAPGLSADTTYYAKMAIEFEGADVVTIKGLITTD